MRAEKINVRQLIWNIIIRPI